MNVSVFQWSRCNICTFDYFFFNDTATTEIYTLSLHDALPIYSRRSPVGDTHSQSREFLVAICGARVRRRRFVEHSSASLDRKSTRLNSSHANISYAVFCLKKKKISLASIYNIAFVNLTVLISM